MSLQLQSTIGLTQLLDVDLIKYKSSSQNSLANGPRFGQCHESPLPLDSGLAAGEADPSACNASHG